MKKMKDQLKQVSKSLASLAQQVDRLSTQISKSQPAKKTVLSKPAPVRRKAVQKAAASKKSSARGGTVLDSVYNTITRSQKGITIAALKSKTKLDSRQLSNALYKLTKKGLVHATSRGIYEKK